MQTPVKCLWACSSMSCSNVLLYDLWNLHQNMRKYGRRRTRQMLQIISSSVSSGDDMASGGVMTRSDSLPSPPELIATATAGSSGCTGDAPAWPRHGLTIVWHAVVAQRCGDNGCTLFGKVRSREQSKARSLQGGSRHDHASAPVSRKREPQHRTGRWCVHDTGRCFRLLCIARPGCCFWRGFRLVCLSEPHRPTCRAGAVMFAM